MSRFISAREHDVFSELKTITEKFKADASKSRNASSRALVKEIEASLETFASIDGQLAKIADVEKRQKAILVSLETQTQEITSQVRVFNENEIKQLGTMEKVSTLISLVSVGAVLVIVLLAIVMILRMAQTLMAISDGVRHSSVETKSASRSLQVGAQKVSSATIDQASAIQETVATLNQISAMVSKSVESANISSERAHNSLRIANEGRSSVKQMQNAMTEIQDNIGALGLQVGNSNKEFEGIVTIINEIVNKTQVIHDIVFQTKLLSFNASVEAARAGEHGKGFAVVAEEVGNLAQMSGQAAREINELLSKSRGNVEQIVKDSKTQMERLVQHGSERVKNGANLANRCEEILGQVVENVDSVTSFMEQIVNASKEQAEGVNNITIAMTEIDTSTHINSTLAHETMGHSSHLAEQANELETTVIQLDSMIRGEAAALSRSTQQNEPSISRDKPTSKDLPQPRKASASKKVKATPPPVSDMPSADDPGFEDVA